MVVLSMQVPFLVFPTHYKVFISLVNVSQQTKAMTSHAEVLHMYKNTKQILHWPFRNKLGANTALNDARHFIAVCDIDRDADLILQNRQQVVQCLSECSDYHCGMHLLLKEWSGNRQHLTSCISNINTATVICTCIYSLCNVVTRISVQRNLAKGRTQKAKHTFA